MNSYVNSQENVTLKTLNIPNKITLHNAKIEFVFRLFNGQYIDDWIQVNVTLENEQIEEDLTIDGQFLRINFTKAIIYQGRYFDVLSKRGCMLNATIFKSKNFLNVQLDHNTCLIHKVFIFNRNQDSSNNDQFDFGVFMYSLVGNLIVLLYMISIENLIKQCKANTQIAANISHYSIEWLLLQIWVYGQNYIQIDFENNFYSGMIKLFSKFYFISFVSFIIMIKLLVVEELYFFMVFGMTWYPQILWNFFHRYRKAPNWAFCIFSSMLHLFFPLYVRCIDGNFLYFRPKQNQANLILYSQGISLFILLLQRVFGARFCFPKQYRKNICGSRPYVYKVKFDEQNEETEISDNKKIQEYEKVDNSLEISQSERSMNNESSQEECVICLNSLRFDGQTQNLKEYMRTPCNHKFHEACLKQWSNIRLECPSCRQEIPPLEIPQDDEDY
ncbi:ring finger ubiquitin ligase [Stylonychia lemnae]|uniref:RING-type E3 ubiquitin transferase n=1 Tax=Stylonychia lemnae TaxID=5949 RepID=A0A078AMZ2_STYLE|nr:ring finger ubiquitin ligase [Stylonychia lemnae]|eukprot:CDW82737.1 ring finger ubiquitin ligase [Stylonychia lemnae]